MASTSLIHETDLVVSINDLDNLFNSDEDDLAVSRDLGSHCNGDLITRSVVWHSICVYECVLPLAFMCQSSVFALPIIS